MYFYVPSGWIRKDKMLMKVAVVSFFFAACYLTQFHHRVIWSGRSSEGLYGWKKCRQRATKQVAVKSHHEKAATILKVISGIEENLVRIADAKRDRSVIISGLRSHHASDPFVEGYVKALHALGYTVNYGTPVDKRRHDGEKGTSEILCLEELCEKKPEEGRSFFGSPKVNHILGFLGTIAKIDAQFLCASGEASGAFACMDPSSSSADTVEDNSSWILTQQTGHTFVTVSAQLLPYFMVEMRKSPGIIGKHLQQEPFTVLDRAVRLSLYVLATGQYPTVFFVHSEGTVRIGKFLIMGHSQDHDSELSWNFAQFRKYLQTLYSESRIQEFFQEVRAALSDVFNNIPTVDLDRSSQTCLGCYHILEVGMLVNASLRPHVTSITEHSKLENPAIPSVVLQGIVSLLLDQPNPKLKGISSQLKDLAGLDFDDIEISDTCGNQDVIPCINSENLRMFFETAIMASRALQYGLEFLSGYQQGSPALSDLLLSVVMCTATASDPTPFYLPKESEDFSGIFSAEKHCQHDSLFRSLLGSVDFTPKLEISPSFHPLTTSYSSRVTFNTTAVEMDFHPADCGTHVVVSGETAATRNQNFTIGIGENTISIHITKNSLSSETRDILRNYTFKITRSPREEVQAINLGRRPHQLCHLRQACAVKMYPDELCGVQPEIGQNLVIEDPVLHHTCKQLTNLERWIMPCADCSVESSCDWTKAVWSPDACQKDSTKKTDIRSCLRNKKLIFIGDSTNRGILTYLLQQLNGTLWEDDKTHSIRTVSAGDETTFAFAYYPQFWLQNDLRPSFKKTVYQGLKAVEPLANNSDTVFVVGGLQFLRPYHLLDLKKVLSRRGLQGSMVLVKSLGSGFFIPAPGIHHVSTSGIQTLMEFNGEIVKTVSDLGFRVIDTFTMTTSRYDEFYPGKCSCHFHSVEPVESTLAIGNHTHKTFTVRGPINEAYSQQVLRAVCSN